MLTALPDLLPCEDCGNHFRAFMETVNLEEACDSRDNLSNLMCQAHNKVNDRTGKAIFPCEAAIARYATSALCAASEKEDSGHEPPDVETLVKSLRKTVTLGLQHEGVAQGICNAPRCAES